MITSCGNDINRWWKLTDDRKIIITQQLADDFNAELGRIMGKIKPGQEAWQYKHELVFETIKRL